MRAHNLTSLALFGFCFGLLSMSLSVSRASTCISFGDLEIWEPRPCRCQNPWPFGNQCAAKCGGCTGMNSTGGIFYTPDDKEWTGYAVLKCSWSDPESGPYTIGVRDSLCYYDLVCDSEFVANGICVAVGGTCNVNLQQSCTNHTKVPGDPTNHEDWYTCD